MRTSKAQAEVLRLIGQGYFLGSYFAPHGKWHLALDGHTIIVQWRTVKSLYDRGLIGGNIYWPHVTSKGWDAVHDIREKKTEDQ